MDSSETAHSALDAIDTVVFKVGLKGYNVDEVDKFLERLSGEARQLKDQLVQQRQQLRQAAERINQLESGRGALAAPTPPPAPRAGMVAQGAEHVTAMIAMAQEFIEHAQQEAEQKAREMTGVAQERARAIVAEARSRAEDEVNRLNGLKQRLSEDVETLTRQLDSERTRLSGVLAEFSRWIESSLHVSSLRTSGSNSETPAKDAPPAAPTPARLPVSVESDETVVSMVNSEGARDSAAESTVPLPTIGQILNFQSPVHDNRV